VRPQQDAYAGLNRGCLRLNWSRSEEAIVTVIGRTARNDYLIPFGLGRDCGSPIPHGRDLFHPTLQEQVTPMCFRVRGMAFVALSMRPA